MNPKKIETDFISSEITFQPTRLVVTVKEQTHVIFTSIQVQEWIIRNCNEGVHF